MGGNLTVTSEWLGDTNGEYTKVKNLTLKNVSDSDIKWAYGSATTPGGITYTGAANPFTDVATQSSAVSAADRTIVPGETQVVDLNSYTKWVRMDGGSTYDTPSRWPAPTASSPIFNLFLRVYTPGGSECVPSPLGSHGPLMNLEISPPAP